MFSKTAKLIPASLFVLACMVCLALLAVGFSAAQTTTYTISGTVREEGSGNPISNAHVQTTSGPYYEAWTDGGGYFEIVMEEGEYDVRISRSGYEDATNHITVSQDEDFGDIYMSPTGGEGGGDGGSIFDGGDGEEGEGGNPMDLFGDASFLPKGLEMLLPISGILCMLTPFILLIMTVALFLIFGRLGRIRKSIDKLGARQAARAEAMRQSQQPQQQPQQQQTYQEPQYQEPAYQEPAYQEQAQAEPRYDDDVPPPPA